MKRRAWPLVFAERVVEALDVRSRIIGGRVEPESLEVVTAVIKISGGGQRNRYNHSIFRIGCSSMPLSGAAPV